MQFAFGSSVDNTSPFSIDFYYNLDHLLKEVTNQDKFHEIS